MGYTNLLDKVPKDLADKIEDAYEADRRLFRLLIAEQKRRLTLKEREEVVRLSNFCDSVREELYERMGKWYGDRLGRLVGGGGFSDRQIKLYAAGVRIVK